MGYFVPDVLAEVLDVSHLRNPDLIKDEIVYPLYSMTEEKLICFVVVAHHAKENNFLYIKEKRETKVCVTFFE